MEEIITILTSSIGIGAIVFFALKSYFGEKFKNIATLQDIGKITHEVESVKKVFQDGTENLKSQLSVLTNKHNVIFVEEKEALIKFLSAWDIWIGIMKLDLSDYGFFNHEELNKLKGYYNEKYDRVQEAISKLELFLDNDEIITAAQTLFTDSYEYQKKNLEYISKAQMFFLTHNHLDVQLQLISSGKYTGSETATEIKYKMDSAMVSFTADKVKYKLEGKPIIVNILAQRHGFISISKKHIRRDIK